MPRDGDQIRTECPRPKRHFEKALHRVGMEQGVRTEPMRQLRHGLNGHDRARFVIHHHDAHKDRVRTQRRLQALHTDAPEGIRLQISHFKAALLQLLHRVQDGVMLHGGSDEVLPALAEAFGRGKNRPVVRLRAAGGKKHAVRLRAERLRDGLPCVPQQPRRVDAEAVLRARVAPIGRQSFCDRLNRLRAGVGRSGVIQIDHTAPSGVHAIWL